MDGDHFNPHGFAIAGSAALAVGIGCAIIHVGNNVAEVTAEHRDAVDAEAINDRFREALTSHDEMSEIVRRQNRTIEEMAANIDLLVGICEAQAAELARR